jgi:hypothetical protein
MVGIVLVTVPRQQVLGNLLTDRGLVFAAV